MEKLMQELELLKQKAFAENTPGFTKWITDSIADLRHISITVYPYYHESNQSEYVAYNCFKAFLTSSDTIKAACTFIIQNLSKNASAIEVNDAKILGDANA